MTTESMRERFDEWYAENAFGYAQNFASSRDCGLQWKAWQAATLAERERAKNVNLTVEDIRAAGGIVHSDGNVFFKNIDQAKAAFGVAADRESIRKGES